MRAPVFNHRPLAILVLLAATLNACSETDRPAPPEPDGGESGSVLPSWVQGPTRDRIIDFVERVTAPNSPAFIPPSGRIAVFDNDGTLWSEQPVYFQLLFAMDRVRAEAGNHPDWQDRQPFKGVLEGDVSAVLATGESGLLELLMATHSGMTTEDFEAIVTAWIGSARHPELDRPYTELVYQPMLELLEYLGSNGFKNYIVSGGGIEFMRPWTERVYGIPPEQVIGSSIKVGYALENDSPVLIREAEIDFIDDKEGKPVAIHKFIGRRPVIAFGNSDGDLQMLQWTAAGSGPYMAALVRHTDADREWAYDRESHVGRLDAALDQAGAKDWLVVDMQRDWKAVHPPRAD